jgi:tRNA nucleotidyltransferase/poly(A) polymerase
LSALRAAAEAHDGPVLCVGGAVRDALLWREPADVDVAVGGDLDAFVELFARQCGRRPVAIRDLWRDTRRTSLGGVQVDLGALLGDERNDLAARDFTVNAMAVRLADSGPAEDRRAGALLDPFDGIGDLQRRRIRMLSAAALADDPLRMLRAVRYVAVLEGFALDDATRAAIDKRAGTIMESAAERVQTEWASLLAAPGWLAGLRLASELGLVAPTLGIEVGLEGAEAWRSFEIAQHAGVPAAGPPPWTGAPAERLPSETPAADEAGPEAAHQRLAAMIAGTPGLTSAAAGEALVARRWPHRAVKRAVRVAEWARALQQDGDTVAWALEDREAAGRAAALARALWDAGDEVTSARIAALELHARRAAEQPWVRGGDLRSWGLEEGPRLGELLHEAARGQLERRWPSAADARAWARDRVTAVTAAAGR